MLSKAQAQLCLTDEVPFQGGSLTFFQNSPNCFELDYSRTPNGRKFCFIPAISSYLHRLPLKLSSMVVVVHISEISGYS